jgi:ferric iron reductase protein FhuF
MESIKQEKSNLMSDNPVAKDASGARGGSFMSKHCCSTSRLSPIKHCGPAHK